MDEPLSEAEQGRRDAHTVTPYLDSAYTAGPDGLADGSSTSDDLQQSSLTLQGGDIHRDLYRIQARSRTIKRSATLGPNDTLPSPPFTGPNIDVGAPGGFRRQFVLRRSATGFSQIDTVGRSFVQFLDLYGGFAGENFGESDASDDEDSHERRPLLPRRRTALSGDAGVSRSFFTLIKAFIGTGILFLPKAFRNGGILFSTITLVTISTISYICFYLLLQCREQYKCGYGDLGETIGGRWFRKIILASIFVSQMGFVCAGLIFTADNLHGFLEASLGERLHLSVIGLVGVQLAVLIPLAFLRNMSKLGPVALVADVFIFVGLFYIWWHTISTLSTRGIEPSVVLFNPQDFALTIGSTIFTFEGVGLIIPIQSAMTEPQKFPKLLLIVMFFITIVFTSIGALCYATFGEYTRVEIFENFSQESKVLNLVQFVYALAVLGGAPVQLFPAIRVLEVPLFRGKSGKKSLRVKWGKNMLRTMLALVCGAISIAAASNLDKFVAFSGSFACVPLVYIYPPLLHLKGVAKTRAAKALDISILVFGFVAMIYTTGMNVRKWFQ